MNIILQSSSYTLRKSKSLLNRITDNQLSDHSVPPYFSCIGSHVRHILDFYDCILDGIASKKIDLTTRKRDERLHGDSSYALKHLERIINAIHNIDADSLNQGFLVTDDLGLGCVTIEYKLGAILAQANSHTIERVDKREMNMVEVGNISKGIIFYLSNGQISDTSTTC